MPDAARAAREKKVVQCGYMAPFYLHNKLRGRRRGSLARALEASLMDPHDDPEFTRHLLKRLCDFFYEQHYRMFEMCKGLIDVAQVTDDYGSQTGPMISLVAFREFYKPHLQRFIDLCHGFGIKVFHHDDGGIRPFIPDLVEMGIDILNPVQSVCPGMERAGLKRDFGRALCFHGSIENQRPFDFAQGAVSLVEPRILPYGTPEDVRADVRDAIDTLASDGTGYRRRGSLARALLAPCHNLQAVTPIGNIIVMYDEAFRYGVF